MGDLFQGIREFVRVMLILGGISIVVFVIASLIAEAKKKG
jgi:hypothetical protein